MSQFMRADGLDVGLGLIIPELIWGILEFFKINKLSIETFWKVLYTTVFAAVGQWLARMS